MTSSPSVLLVEDQRLMMLGLRIALESQDGCTIVGESIDGRSAVQDANRLRPEVVLMDIGMPQLDGIEATWQIKQNCPHTRVIMLTSHTDSASVSAAFGAGADGYCAKNASVDKIITAICAVMRGELWLDPSLAEIEVTSNQLMQNRSQTGLSTEQNLLLNLVQEGMDFRQISQRLNKGSDNVAAIMQQIIRQFADKDTSKKSDEVKHRERLYDWLTALVDNLGSGTIFGEKYLLQELVGSGAMGAVFKAKHLYMNRTVALKVLRPEVSEGLQVLRSFQREATAIANLQHENIVEVYDFGISANNELFLVMEYVEGTNLADILATHRRLSPARTVGLCVQICNGLMEAHGKGIIHCDLKPSNILVTQGHHQETIKLVDFGLVQWMPPDGSSTQQQATAKHTACGSPAYMSPEHCTGKTLDGRTDIYALGCILFESLTGRPVFPGTNTLEVLGKHAYLVAPKISDIFQESADYFPPELEGLVAEMLAKDPSRRPQSMSRVKRRLQALAVLPR